MKTYRYETCCVECANCVEDLDYMIDTAVDITYRTMRKHCDGLDSWAVNHGYDLHPKQGLTLVSDWHVSYHKSTFKGRSCYFLRWSGIEFIWTKGGSEAGG